MRQRISVRFTNTSKSNYSCLITQTFTISLKTQTFTGSLKLYKSYTSGKLRLSNFSVISVPFAFAIPEILSLMFLRPARWTARPPCWLGSSLVL